MQSLNVFPVALRMMETGGDYQCVNTLNFLGAYQFGEAALLDLGYVGQDSDPYDNDYSGGWKVKNGIDSAKEFLASTSVQDLAAEAWVTLMSHCIEDQHLDSHVWKMVGVVELSPSGMLAASHLMGTYSLQAFIESDGKVDPRDPCGMPVSSVMIRMATVEKSYGPKPTATKTAPTRLDLFN